MFRLKIYPTSKYFTQTASLTFYISARNQFVYSIHWMFIKLLCLLNNIVIDCPSLSPCARHQFCSATTDPSPGSCTEKLDQKINRLTANSGIENNCVSICIFVFKYALNLFVLFHFIYLLESLVLLSPVTRHFRKVHEIFYIQVNHNLLHYLKLFWTFTSKDPEILGEKSSRIKVLQCTFIFCFMMHSLLRIFLLLVI